MMKKINSATSPITKKIKQKSDAVISRRCVSDVKVAHKGVMPSLAAV
jgi:hypothetical protein